jgi:hypothetical protein
VEIIVSCLDTNTFEIFEDYYIENRGKIIELDKDHLERLFNGISSGIDIFYLVRLIIKFYPKDNDDEDFSIDGIYPGFISHLDSNMNYMTFETVIL